MTYAKLPGLTWDGTVYENQQQSRSPLGSSTMAGAWAVGQPPVGSRASSVPISSFSYTVPSQVRRLWTGGSAGGAGRPHCQALRMEAAALCGWNGR